jgi:hypothetical protein
MNVLAIGHLTGKDIQPHIPAEAKVVAEMKKEGLIRDLFLKADMTGPILVLNDTNAEDARRRLATLPFVEEHLVAFELIELNDLPSAAPQANGQ